MSDGERFEDFGEPAVESIDRILEKQETKQHIGTLHQKVIELLTHALGETPSTENFADVGPAVCRAYEEGLRDILVGQLGSPPYATGRDLGAAFEQHLLVAREAFDQAYPGFCSAVLGACEE